MLATIRPWCGAALIASGVLWDARAAPVHPITQLVQQKRFPDAARVIAERLAADPGDAPALAGMVDLVVAQDAAGRVPEAKAAAERCVAANPTSSTCAEALGRALEAQASGWMAASLGNTRAQRDAYERAVLLDPTNYRARVSLVRFYLRAPFFLGGSTIRARELALEVNRTDPDLTRLMLALCAHSEERPQDAEEYVLAADLGKYELVTRVHRDLLSRLAEAHLDAQRFADSARLYAELHRRIPSSESGSYGLAQVARARDKLADAAFYLERAVAIGPKPYVFASLAEVYQAQNDNPRAIAAYQSALGARPALERRRRQEIMARLAQLQQR
ncbi:tetratricopeptide repeat protein [Massilia sp. DD77]|uniref:tetratricopeptide repeat protein n=1 Tax=Massilia sp. DD77 TaxID=3109349 RepID=UPI002FFD6C14